jgi:hypothetical protein
MKLENRTVSILKNFATINPSLMFTPGSTLRTMSPQKTVLAEANIVENIDGEFAIYDVSRLLSVMSLFEQPDILVRERYLTMTDGHQKVDYTFADPKMIVLPSDKTPTVPDPEICFHLSADTLAKVQKAMGILSMPELAVVGDGETMYVQAIDSKNPSGDSFAATVGNTEHKFKMIFKADNMKLISGDYDVEISSRGIACFKGADVKYWVATEATSTFEAK